MNGSISEFELPARRPAMGTSPPPLRQRCDCRPQRRPIDRARDALAAVEYLDHAPRGGRAG